MNFASRRRRVPVVRKPGRPLHPRRRRSRTAPSCCRRSPERWSDDRGLARPAVPARRHLGRRGHELLAVLGARRARRAVPVRRGRRRAAHRARRSAPRSTGTATCRASGPGSATATACTAPTSPRRGCASTRPSCSSTPTPRRSTAACAGSAPTRSPTRPTTPRAPTSSPTTRTRADAIPRSVVVDTGFDWEGDRPPRIPWSDIVIYEAHVRGFTRLHPDVREDLRGTYAGLASDPAIEYLTSLGVTAVELMPVHHIVDESFLAERGLTNYWGYSSIGYLAPHAGYAATGTRGEQVLEFKGMVKALHRAGIEVILDVVYNHTVRGQPPRPDALVQGRRQPVLLPPDAGRAALLHGLHRHGQQPQPGPPERAAADHGLAALLGRRVPRGRLPLRPRLGAGARVLRRGPALGLLRHDPPGPAAVAGEADRGAVGRRAGRLPGGELPGALDRVERDLPRHDARLLARPRRAPPSSRAASPGRATCTSRTAAARSRRSTSSPPTTASRCATSSPTTRSTTRRTSRAAPTAPTTTAAGTTAPRGRPTTRQVNELRERQQRNFLATLLLSHGVPMLLGGDEFSRSQGGNNNAWCQDNEISWFGWEPRRARASGCSSSRGG